MEDLAALSDGSGSSRGDVGRKDLFLARKLRFFLLVLASTLLAVRRTHVEEDLVVFLGEGRITKRLGFLSGKRAFADWSLPHLNNSKHLVSRF